MTHHPQVDVNGVLVDEGMAPLLCAMWARGIKTCLSCQENKPGIAWIAFLTPQDVRKFHDTALEKASPDLTSAILRQSSNPPHPYKGFWDYTFVIDRHIVYSVRFPTLHIPELTDIFSRLPVRRYRRRLCQ